jgi:hypothetical protein
MEVAAAAHRGLGEIAFTGKAGSRAASVSMAATCIT